MGCCLKKALRAVSVVLFATFNLLLAKMNLLNGKNSIGERPQKSRFFHYFLLHGKIEKIFPGMV
jgi:hypothetical protein